VVAPNTTGQTVITEALFDLPDAAAPNAQLSNDRVYRYQLTRPLTAGTGPTCVFVMLNPSTADKNTDDPTVRRCKHFAIRLRCSLLIIVNLYAYRATDPRQLWKVTDPVGPNNDKWLRDAAAQAHNTNGYVIAAWGGHARPDRVQAATTVLTAAGPIHCLGTTRAGAPRHPLYLRNDSPLLTWPHVSPRAGDSHAA